MQNALATVIGGVIVASFTYFFLREDSPKSDVYLERYAVPYSEDVLESIKANAKLAVEAALNRTVVDPAGLAESMASFQLGEFAQNSIFGDGGTIELNLIKNNDSFRSVTVLIEITDEEYTAIRSSDGVSIHSNKVSKEIKLIPKETASVFHITKYPGVFLTITLTEVVKYWFLLMEIILPSEIDSQILIFSLGSP